jgi:hydroxymethylbilane synthase
MDFYKKPNEHLIIKAGARSSPLSQVQLREVLNELRLYYPHVNFEPLLVLTTGDKCLNVSLRSLNKTNFFTKEIDEFLLTGKCRIGIHSAKDLPEPIPFNLQIVAVTKGLDSSDSLVLRPGEALDTLRKKALVATSSERRENMARLLRPDLTFKDLRGTIGQRLLKLDSKEVDGVIVAEAALIRLGLTYLNRLKLPGDTVSFQGQLAILARKEDREIEDLFSVIDSRQKAIYLGLETPEETCSKKFFHFPIIKILPFSPELPEIQKMFSQIHEYTHFIFTSKNGVRIFFKYLSYFKLDKDLLSNKTIITIGKKTTDAFAFFSRAQCCVAEEETAEGVVNILKKSNLSDAYVCWPHSALSRPILKEFFINNKIRFYECAFYDTQPHLSASLPYLHQIIKRVDEIVFTSPSTVNAFFHFVGELPQNKILTTIGPITQNYLENLEKACHNCMKSSK